MILSLLLVDSYAGVGGEIGGNFLLLQVPCVSGEVYYCPHNKNKCKKIRAYSGSTHAVNKLSVVQTGAGKVGYFK